MSFRVLKTLFLLGLVTLSVSACDLIKPNPECVASDEMGDVVGARKQIPSSSAGWKPTNIRVSQDGPLAIEINSGALNLCGVSSQDVSILASQLVSNPFGYMFPMPGSTSPKAYGPYVAPGDIVRIEVPAPAPRPSYNVAEYMVSSNVNMAAMSGFPGSADATCVSNSNNCWLKNGAGLKVGVTQSQSPFAGTPLESFYSIIFPGLSGSAVQPLTSETSVMAFSGLSQAPLRIPSNFTGGYLTFNIMDTDGVANNNYGGYALKVTRYGCPKNNGEALFASIQPNGTSPSGDTSDMKEMKGGFDGNAWATGNVWLKIKDSDSDLGNNRGSYNVQVKTTHKDLFSTSYYLNIVITNIKKTLERAQMAVYQSMINTRTANIIHIMIVLYVIIYGICFTFGMIQDTQSDFLRRVVKIAIINQLTMPGSFDFFNTYIFSLFTDGRDYLIYVMSNAHKDIIPAWQKGAGIDFGFIDDTIGVFFRGTTWIKILALLVGAPFGFIYVIIIFLGMYLFLKAVVGAIIIYLLALIAVTLLVAMAPLFISFALFPRTRNLFDNWIKELFNYALQPVMVFAALALFHYIMVATIERLFSFSACWDCVAPKIPIIPGVLEICWFAFYTPRSTSADGGYDLFPISFLEVLIFLIVAYSAGKFVNFAQSLAKVLVGSPEAPSLGAAAAGIQHKAGQNIKGLVGRDKSSQKRHNAKASKARAAKKRDGAK